MKLSVPAREIVTIIRRHRLNYDTLRVATYQARKYLTMKPPKRGRRLPSLLTDEELRRFYNTIDRAENIQHQIMLRLLFFAGLRVSELVKIEVADVDITGGKIFIREAKGDKDRVVLFPDHFRLALRSYVGMKPDNKYLFESRRKDKFTTRQIQHIVSDYAAAAELTKHVHPHLLRHGLLTWLTAQGMTDAQIQVISGHSSKQSLERYQHLSVKDAAPGYQDAMKKLGM